MSRSVGARSLGKAANFRCLVCRGHRNLRSMLVGTEIGALLRVRFPRERLPRGNAWTLDGVLSPQAHGEPTLGTRKGTNSMRRMGILAFVGIGLVTACTESGGGGSLPGGSECSAHSECASGTCVGASSSSEGEGEQGVESTVRPSGTCSEVSNASSSSSSSGASGSSGSSGGASTCTDLFQASDDKPYSDADCHLCEPGWVCVKTTFTESRYCVLPCSSDSECSCPERPAGGQRTCGAMPGRSDNWVNAPSKVCVANYGSSG